MNTGQMILTTGALVLLGTTVLTVNKNNLNQGTVLRQTEIGIYAVSLGTSYVEKATSLNFDEYTVANMIANGKTDSLTPGKTSGNALGTETSTYGAYDKVYEKTNADSTFDDFDDYNGFSKFDTVKGADVFTTSISVKYCDTAGVVQSSARTFYKRMDVKTWGTVSRNAFEGASPNGTDTIKFSYIFSYIYKI
jgi:hypothetical protein